MTEREITRLRVINHTIEGIITIGKAADLLNLSERQVIRLKGGVLKEGPAFIIHKNRGRKPSHVITGEMKQTIVELKQSKEHKQLYYDTPDPNASGGLSARRLGPRYEYESDLKLLERLYNSTQAWR